SRRAIPPATARSLIPTRSSRCRSPPTPRRNPKLRPVVAPHPPAARVPPSPRLRGESWGEGLSPHQSSRQPAKRAVAGWLTALAAVVVAFLSASQDIVIDAYRIELLRPEEQGAGAAATQWGYRFGMLAASAGALYAASFGGWSFAYALMAGLMFIGMAAVWFTPEPGGIHPFDPLPGDSPLNRLAAWL